MDDAVRDAFAEAVAVALREMAGVEAAHTETRRDVGGAPWGEAAALIRLLTPARGAMVVSMSAATASALTARVLADAAPAPDAAMIADCLGEVANVIAGQAKTLLNGTPFHFTIATPTAVRGAAAGEAWTRLTFQTELGAVTVFVELIPDAS